MNFYTAFNRKIKTIFISIFLCCSGFFIQAQHAGINSDPNQSQLGNIPYEMEGRVEDRIPLIDFDDCTKWEVTSENCEVNLYRTQEQRVFREFSGKVVYKASAEKASFSIQLKKPIELKEPWDCINFWNYGDHWIWESNAKSAMDLLVLIKDSGGKIHELKMVQQGYGKMSHKYWFLNHMKLINEISGPASFLGFKFVTKRAELDKEHILFLESVYAYKEALEPVTFQSLPEKMPFPLREQTILPINKLDEFENSVNKKGSIYSFIYEGADGKIVYELEPYAYLKNLTVRYNNKKKVKIAQGSEVVIDTEEDVQWNIIDQSISNDTVYVAYELRGSSIQQHFSTWYTIKQKSLICGIDEKGDSGVVSEIKLGSTEVNKDARLTLVPMLNFHNYDRPAILYSADLFHFTMFDWYYSNASKFTGGRKKIEEGKARFNEGVKYIPLINGKRNLLREKLFINASPDVQEVLPTIDNPKSPMREAQADRLWVINGGTDLDVLGDFVKNLRSKGVEKVSIRYHEGFWREGGESYTFKTDPNPSLGDKKIKEYVSWVKSMDWRVGLYTNYTDYAPVNANWNENWVKQGPNGEWEVSWSRCYSPKPQIAWEQQAIFAPKIQQKFGTNHSYCDVHTAVSPMTRVDYDYRVPGAGTFRHVINCYGLLLMNESRTYQGPVYSEGGNHWWYAGLLDGNYANGKLDRLPVFPDFQLMQIHPKEMDAGHTGKDNAYFAYTLAYGNIGLLTEGIDAVKKYAFLQPLQNNYVMIPFEKIEYFEDGIAYSSSDAIKKDLIKEPKLHIAYESGFQVYTNFSDELWNVEAEGKEYLLGKYGVLAFQPNTNLMSFSGIMEASNQKRIDRVISEDLCFIDTFGETVVEGKVRGKGSYLIKKEKFGWELIPLGEKVLFDFDNNLLEISADKFYIQAVDQGGYTMDVDPLLFEGDSVYFNHHADANKYKIIPVR